jgi:hypothetical protein
MITAVTMENRRIFVLFLSLVLSILLLSLMMMDVSKKNQTIEVITKRMEGSEFGTDIITPPL